MCEGVIAKHWKGGKNIDKNGYILIYSPNHPFARSNGKTKYVCEHRLVVEKKLGRFLTREEVIHHKNGNKQDNRIENLQLFNQSEHIKLEWKNGSMENSKKTQFKKGMTSWLKGKKLSSEHREKCIKTLTPFKKGHSYFPRKALG